MVAIWKYVEWWNSVAKANKKANIPTINDGPQIWEVVRAVHPGLVCTEGKRIEWFTCREDGTYDPVLVVENLIGDVMHRLQKSEDGWKRRSADIAATLIPLCTIHELTRRPCLIKWETRTAVDFSEVVKTAVGAVACKSKWFLLLRDGTAKEHKYGRSVFLLNRVPSDPDFDRTPTFTNQWIEERLGAEQGRALWEWMSYCLTPGNALKKFHVWVGEKDTGKSTGVALLTTLLGSENVSDQPALSLLEKFVFADIRGKLLNVSEEDSGYGHEFEKVVKKITGDGRMNFELKFGAVGSSRPSTKLMFTTNNVPTIVDPSGAFAGRMVLLAWTRPVTGRKDGIDPIKDQFREELPAILGKCLRIRGDIAASGEVFVPAQSRAAVEEIALDSNTVALWMKDNTWAKPSSVVPKSDVYRDYDQWCRRNNQSALRSTEFMRRIKQTEAWKTSAIGEGERGPRSQGRPRTVRGLVLCADEQRRDGLSLAPEGAEERGGGAD